MTPLRAILCTAFAMIAFAGNSLLCRAAFNQTGIDAASFTTIRLLSGAAVLWLLTRFRPRPAVGNGNGWSAFWLFVYAAGFSFAYVQLSAATGALLLFGAVQATMIGYGLWQGERLNKRQLVGLVLAAAGLVGLLLPGLTSPPIPAAALMLTAGAAWGVYSLRGKAAADPVQVTAGNFMLAVPFTLVLSLLTLGSSSADFTGAWYATLSGALTSGIGYVIWYSALPALKPTNAATVQLSVPVITALGGVALLGEAITPRLAVATVTVLTGIAMVILGKQER